MSNPTDVNRGYSWSSESKTGSYINCGHKNTQPTFNIVIKMCVYKVMFPCIEYN